MLKGTRFSERIPESSVLLPNTIPRHPSSLCHFVASSRSYVRIFRSENLLFAAADFLTERSHVIEEKRIDHTPAENGQPDRVHQTWHASPLFPAGDAAGTLQSEDLSVLLLTESSDPAVLPQEIWNLFARLVVHIF